MDGLTNAPRFGRTSNRRRSPRLRPFAGEFVGTIEISKEHHDQFPALDHEGPELGGRDALIERFERRAPLAVAVFTSAGCSLCAALEPSLRLLANDPEIELQLFDEHADADAWESLAVPGSPYAVVLAPDGEVLAKGTFNSLYQLESLLGPAAVRA